MVPFDGSRRGWSQRLTRGEYGREIRYWFQRARTSTRGKNISHSNIELTWLVVFCTRIYCMISTIALEHNIMDCYSHPPCISVRAVRDVMNPTSFHRVSSCQDTCRPCMNLTANVPLKYLMTSYRSLCASGKSKVPRRMQSQMHKWQGLQCTAGNIAI